MRRTASRIPTRLARTFTLLPFLIIPLLFSAAQAAIPENYLEDPDAQGYRAVRLEYCPRPFKDAFTVSIDDTVKAWWSTAMLDTFMTAVFDSLHRESMFPVIADYFWWGDDDPAWDTIEYAIGLQSYTKVRILLRGTGIISTAPEDAVRITAYADFEERPYSAWETAWRSDLPHEIGHILHRSNIVTNHAADWNGELFAVGVEAVAGRRPLDLISSQAFDASLLSRIGPSGSTFYPYPMYRMFMAYLLAQYSDPQDRTNDLLWRWAHAPQAFEDFTSGDDYTDFYWLSRTLAVDSLFTYDGVTGDERLGNLFHRGAIALYANLGDSLGSAYGFGDYTNPREAAYFAWQNEEALRARTLPPVWMVGEAELAGPRTEYEFEDVLDTEKTPACRTRPLGLRAWGSDYLVIQADSAFFASAGDTNLCLRIRGRDAMPSNQRVRVGYLAYDTTEEPLYEAGPTSIVDVIATVSGQDTLDVSFCVPHFGVTVQSVVIVTTLVDEEVSKSGGRAADNSVTCFTAGGGSEPDVPYRVTMGYIPQVISVPNDSHS